MNRSTPGFPVHHQWAESTQTHVHWVGDAIQPSHPLSSPSPPFSYFFKIYFILFFNFTMLYWFCHISTWIHHRYTRVPHPEPSSLLPPRTIPLSHPSTPAPRASTLNNLWKDWCWSLGSILQLPDVNSWLIGKDPDAENDWRQKMKRETED